MRGNPGRRNGEGAGSASVPSSAEELAGAYSKLGWALIRANGKVPVGSGWQKTKPVKPEYAAGEWSRWGSRFNLGIVLGASGLAVVEYDTEQAAAKLAELFGSEAPTTPVVRSGSGRWHWYFRADDLEHVTRDGLELRTGDHFMLAPPSMHESGERYRWIVDPWAVPLAAVPAPVLEYLAGARNGNSASPGVVIRNGERNKTLTSLAGAMRRRGAGEASILAALAKMPCETPLDENELRKIAHSVSRYKPEETVIAAALYATPLDGVAMRSIEWLERPLWQRSAFQLLAGAKGAGKGTYLAGLASRVSRTAVVLFISTEDSTAIDLKPRLVAAGANIARCFVIQQHVRLPDDLDALRDLARDLGNVGLLVIDPVANHIGDRDSNSDAQVRDAIAGLNKLADELGCLLIGVRHPGKDRSRGALASILGSTAWVDTPRAVVMIAADDESPDVRVIQVVAGNRSANGAAQAFRIDAVDVPGLSEPITLAVELGESSKQVDDLLGVKKEGSKSAAARELILDILEGEGEQESDALDARIARETGIVAKTVRNLRSDLVNEGLIRSHPDKDEFGEILRWKVSRTAAPR